MPVRVTVKPELLRWARERSGLTVETLSKNRSLAKLPQWELGTRRPTLRQLEAFAKKTFTPAGFFFLSEPPADHSPIPDYRTIGSHGLGATPSPHLLDTIHLCQRRQDWYREYARRMDDDPLPFVASARLQDDCKTVASEMRERLHLDIEARKLFSTWTDALRQFIRRSEDLGVLVMVSGIVGSNTKRVLDPSEFRGFALVDSLAPLVFVNGRDTKAAQMFTLAHELAHIWLGQSGISEPQMNVLPGGLSSIEQWCNRVAAELLVPIDTVRERSLPGRTSSGGGNYYNTLSTRTSNRFLKAVVVSTIEGHTTFTDASDLIGFRKKQTLAELAKRQGLRV